MGVLLFKRHGPRLTATARAKALGQRLEQALLLVRSAVDDCRRIRRPLRVSCAPTFAARWLMPRLASYHSATGADAIVLDNTQTVLPAGNFDVAIRSGLGPWPNCRCAKLMSEQRTPMLSPKWLTGRFTVRRLLETPLIPDPGWADWFKLAGLSKATLTFTSTRFPDYEMEAQAAAQGIGAALLSPVLFADLLMQKTLCAPFSWLLDSGTGYWLLWTDEASQSHFVRWIKAQFGVAAQEELAPAAVRVSRTRR